MLQCPAMAEHDMDDGRPKPYEWLDEVFPYDVDGEENRKAEEEFVKNLLGVSGAVRDISKMEGWDPNNVNYILRVQPDNGYWEFRGQIISVVSRINETPDQIRRDSDGDWDLDERVTEVVEATMVSDAVTSAALLRMQATDRRNALKKHAGHALRMITREMDTSFPSLELEQRRQYVRTAYEHLLKGVVTPGFDAAAVPAKEKSAIMPQPMPDYSI
jgi:hypothetical protein